MCAKLPVLALYSEVNGSLPTRLHVDRTCVKICNKLMNIEQTIPLTFRGHPYSFIWKHYSSCFATAAIIKVALNKN